MSIRWFSFVDHFKLLRRRIDEMSQIILRVFTFRFDRSADCDSIGWTGVEQSNSLTAVTNFSFSVLNERAEVLPLGRDQVHIAVMYSHRAFNEQIVHAMNVCVCVCMWIAYSRRSHWIRPRQCNFFQINLIVKMHFNKTISRRFAKPSYALSVRVAGSWTPYKSQSCEDRRRHWQPAKPTKHIKQCKTTNLFTISGNEHENR